MNARLREPAWIDAACRVYAGLLHLYPRAHRQRWGAEMRQAFRERCREAARDGHGAARWLLSVALPDLLASSVRERFAAAIQSLQGDPMRQFALITSGIVLEVVGSALVAVAAIGLSFAVINNRFAFPGAFDALLWLQVALALGGGALLALGIRQLQAAVKVMPA